MNNEGSTFFTFEHSSQLHRVASGGTPISPALGLLHPPGSQAQAPTSTPASVAASTMQVYRSPMQRLAIQGKKFMQRRASHDASSSTLVTPIDAATLSAAAASAQAEQSSLPSHMLLPDDCQSDSGIPLKGGSKTSRFFRRKKFTRVASQPQYFAGRHSMDLTSSVAYVPPTSLPYQQPYYHQPAIQQHYYPQQQQLVSNMHRLSLGEADLKQFDETRSIPSVASTSMLRSPTPITNKENQKHLLRRGSEGGCEGGDENESNDEKEDEEKKKDPDAIEIDWDEIKLEGKIGNGSFGDVHEGWWHGKVAVKTVPFLYFFSQKSQILTALVASHRQSNRRTITRLEK